VKGVVKDYENIPIGPRPPKIPPNARCGYCVNAKVIKKNSKARCPRGVNACASGIHANSKKLCKLARKNAKNKIPKGCKVKFFRECIGMCAY
jgi:hypothetical protein